MLSPFLAADISCEQTLLQTKSKLSQAGLSAVQTFNLHTARLGLHDCGCPNHGSKACDCQMIVLLVYGELPEPVTLILHGNGGKTWISIADTPPQQGDPKLIASIRRALEDLIAAKAITP